MSDPFFSVIKIVKGSICSNTFYRRDDNGTNIKEAVCNDTACSYADHGSCSHDCVGGAATYSGGIYSSGGDVTINGDVEKITAKGEKAAYG